MATWLPIITLLALFWHHQVGSEGLFVSSRLLRSFRAGHTTTAPGSPNRRFFTRTAERSG